MFMYIDSTNTNYKFQNQKQKRTLLSPGLLEWKCKPEKYFNRRKEVLYRYLFSFGIWNYPTSSFFIKIHNPCKAQELCIINHLKMYGI